ncbi:hypothetical protein BKA70DRAFT_1521297 [Coprinopsis sp. MPI-PUGE-AT-0042]|nr:hypothetical protein BKA70DRAFT_1521297 [Coprinopsis sp. MPI-PUGE-AT-0042]
MESLCALHLTLNEPPVYRDSAQDEEGGGTTPLLEESMFDIGGEGDVPGMQNQNLPKNRFTESTGQPYESFLEPLFASSRGNLTTVSTKGNMGFALIRSILSLLPATVSDLSIPYWPYATAFNTPYSTNQLSTTTWLPRLETLRVLEVPPPRVPQSLALNSISSLASFVHCRLETAPGRTRLRSLGVARGQGSLFFQDEELWRMEGKGLKVAVWAKTEFS